MLHSADFQYNHHRHDFTKAVSQTDHTVYRTYRNTSNSSAVVMVGELVMGKTTS